MSDINPPRDTGVSEQSQRSRRGRPEYKPTDEQRTLVRRLIGEGATKSQVAEQLGITRVTLRKHFAAELGEPVVDDGLFSLPSQPRPAAPIAEPGRPAFEPTYRQREDVQLWKADGWSDDRIARRLRISRNTLLKHFADELSDGADAVRALALRNLRTASNSGSVSASNALLKLSGLEPPPAPPKEVVEPAPEEKLGKKAQAKLAALTAEEGTSWSELVKH